MKLRLSVSIVLSLILSTCEVWGPLDNPGDPRATRHLSPAPSNGGTTSDTTPLLDWGDVTDASGYEIQYASTSGAVEGTTAIAAASSQYQYPSTLAIGDTVYWRVRAKNGDNVWGAWSSTWSFTVTWSYTLTPSPADAGTTSDTTPLLDWNDVTGASGYEIQYASSSGGVEGSTAIPAESSQYQYPSTLALGDAVYWRVRAKNGDNVWGAWSGTWSFTFEPVLMVDILGGSFTQDRQVTLSNYSIGKYEVTFEQYDAFCAATSRSQPSDWGWGRGKRPVICVSWYDAVAFCNWLSAQEGLDAGYSGSGTSWTLDRTKNGYRLPTEAEWEYAARGGVSTHGYAYSGSNDLGAVAWYSSNSGSKTQPVGGKAANELGLYDMSGNAFEWNHDWDGSYPGTAEIDPVGPASGEYRVFRGGDWDSDASSCAVDIRRRGDPSFKQGSHDVGFRVARSITTGYIYNITPDPADAGTTSDTTPLLDWNDVSGASGYEVQYASTSGGVEGSTAIAEASSQYQVTSGLALGTWYWRVRAKNSDNVWGAWSSTWSFTVAWTYSLTPTPTSGGTTSDTTPFLDWNDVTEATGYELQYASTSGGVEGSTAFSAESSQYQYPSTLAIGDTVYWRVRAKNADNVWGAWSSVWSFTVQDIAVGDTGPAGGLVFYDKGSYSDGWRYLEAAPSDQSTYIMWYNGTYLTISTGTEIGSGNANTTAIVAAQGGGSYAASLCDGLSLGGYDDWFLPSKDELNLMYVNLKTAGLGGFSTSWYCSSSQYSLIAAWIQGFSNGLQDYGGTLSNYSVRAVRAF